MRNQSCFCAARHERHTQENKLPVDRCHNYDTLKKNPEAAYKVGITARVSQSVQPTLPAKTNLEL